jgi:hypothetical protein
MVPDLTKSRELENLIAGQVSRKGLCIWEEGEQDLICSFITENLPGQVWDPHGQCRALPAHCVLYP